MLSSNSGRRLPLAGNGGAALLVVPFAVGVMGVSAAPLQAAERTCQGTLLQIKVHQTGTTRSERFRFSLGLEAEASTKAQAMALLNERLDQARRQVKPLALGRLTIPAPWTSRLLRGESSHALGHVSATARQNCETTSSISSIAPSASASCRMRRRSSAPSLKL